MTTPERPTEEPILRIVPSPSAEMAPDADSGGPAASGDGRSRRSLEEAMKSAATPIHAGPVAEAPGEGNREPSPWRAVPRSQAADSNRVLPFRRGPRDRKIRRLRQHPVIRWLRPLLTACVIVAVPITSLFWLATSPRFAVRQVVVRADTESVRVGEPWLHDVMRPALGMNLWRLPLERAKARVFEHPWVLDVSLRKQAPDTLVVRVVERREAALYLHEEKLFYVDGEGRLIAGLGPQDGAVDLPLISGGDPASGSLRRAVALTREIDEMAPAWQPGLSEIEILSERDYRVYTDLPFPLLVRAGTLKTRATRLQELLPLITARFDAVAAVDLRFARRIIVEPAVRNQNRKASTKAT